MSLEYLKSEIEVGNISIGDLEDFFVERDHCIITMKEMDELATLRALELEKQESDPNNITDKRFS